MNTLSISDAISASSYPGRGILIGKTPDARLLMAYFIMGRSVNSRNRVFVEAGAGLRTQAYDPSKLSDPSLIIYAPVRMFENYTIVTNGDQTDTICDALQTGGSFESALRTRAFEPDAPNFTPRISALTMLERGDFSLKMSIIKAADAKGSSACRFFYEYESVAPGLAYFLHTYKCDGDPIPSFEGEPEPVTLPEGSIDALTDAIWQALDRDNRVSLWVRTVNLKIRECETRIVNSNQ